ncbi:unnamed protein product [Gongylonema pulchrum]|uniref:ATP-dependent RNA helicase n=1 Tax=Gongylonema pulchrum TaxID=637853 RepID=A0A183EJU3_9BILA|nr:unnamed protein product [Gongylonema pulchrum]
MNLHPKLLENIRHKGYEKPLPIQRAAFSLICAGYDVIGHAATGGGKTAAYLIPIIDYILAAKTRSGSKASMPYCIVISPTKELAEQLYDDAQDFSHQVDCRVVLCFGEIPVRENITEIRKGCDILIATVGRLCDYLTRGEFCGFYDDLVENLLPRCKAVRLNDLIVGLQKLLFSATDSADLETLKKDFVSPKATKIVVGTLNTVNRHIEQRILLVLFVEHFFGSFC